MLLRPKLKRLFIVVIMRYIFRFGGRRRPLSRLSAFFKFSRSGSLGKTLEVTLYGPSRNVCKIRIITHLVRDLHRKRLLLELEGGTRDVFPRFVSCLLRLLLLLPRRDSADARE